jgi:hypothetical protein
MKLKLGPAQLETDFEFMIPSSISEVAVYLSGGLDSAALLCLILTELKNTQRLELTSIKCFTVIKNDGSMDYADTVVKAISKLFEKEIHHLNYIDNDEDSILKGRVGISTSQTLWKSKGPNTKIFMAINKMAPDDIRPFKQTLKVAYIENPFYDAPFINLHKPQILDIFYKLGCEEIIPITHSCTSIVVGSCKTCYSCQERIWGFSSLGRDDPS